MEGENREAGAATVPDLTLYKKRAGETREIGRGWAKSLAQPDGSADGSERAALGGWVGKQEMGSSRPRLWRRKERAAWCLGGQHWQLGVVLLVAGRAGDGRLRLLVPPSQTGLR